MYDRKWEITFSDMLTLLLTFFVFIISISTFKSEDYKRFWEQFREEKQRKGTRSFKVHLIEGLKMPVLNPEAEKLLTELEETFAESDYEGLNVNYNENKITLMISERLSFAGGESDLKEDAKPLLLELIPGLIKSPFDIEVEGHSDSLSSEKIDNMDLSLDRALAVARFLIENGVDKNKISVSGYGPHRPVADNKTREGRSLNRRVEINIRINNQ